MMAIGLMVGEHVYVPRARLQIDPNGASAFHNTEVKAVTDRSVQVVLPDGNWSAPIGASVVHRNIGVLIFRIGDYLTEWSLLDPLAKSVLQYLRLLLPDDMIHYHAVRSLSELRHYWDAEHGAISHVVLIGHGRRNGVLSAVDDWITSDQLTDTLSHAGAEPKNFVSLCCKTGFASFSQQFSRHSVCQTIIGPFHSVHGAIASQFCQSFFAHHLLEGQTPKVAFKNARSAIPGGSIFRFWQDGKLTGDR